MAPLFGNNDAERKRMSQDLQNLSEQIGELKRDLNARNSEIERLKTDLEQARADSSTKASSDSKALKDAQLRVQSLQKQLERAEADDKAARETQSKVSALEKQLAELSAGAQPPTATAQPDAQTGAVPATGTTEAAAPAAAPGLQAGATAYVAQAGGLPLRLRSRPGLNKDTVLDRLPPGTSMTLLDGPQDADGHSWWHIRTGDGREGWVAGEDLRTRPE